MKGLAAVEGAQVGAKVRRQDGFLPGATMSAVPGTMLATVYGEARRIAAPAWGLNAALYGAHKGFFQWFEMTKWRPHPNTDRGKILQVRGDRGSDCKADLPRHPRCRWLHIWGLKGPHLTSSHRINA